MTIDDIVDSFNKVVYPSDTLILHRGMKEHPKFKVYKKFFYKLYTLSESEKSLIVEKEYSLHCPSEDIEKVWEGCDKLFVKDLIEIYVTCK